MARSPLVQGLRAHGFIVGENVKFESVFSEGQSEKLPELAAELVSRQVDVIWCLGPPAAVAAARATKTIPIVFWGVGFPVELGLVAGFARPGGNVTGMAHTPGPEITTKLFQLIKTVEPRTTRVLSMFEASAVRKVNGEVFLPSEIVDAAVRDLKVDLRRIPLKDPTDADRELAGIRDWKPEAIMVVGDPVTILARERIIGFATEQRIPAVFGMREFALAGGLLSYGPSTAETVRQSASGADPEGIEAGRSARGAAHEIRARGQPQDRSCDRDHRSSVGARAGRRGYRLLKRGEMLLMVAPGYL